MAAAISIAPAASQYLRTMKVPGPGLLA
jgi:hypothetical protein